MNFRARLKKLERRRETGTGKALRLVVRPVIGPTDLAKSTCQRNLCPDGSLLEIVHLNGNGNDLSGITAHLAVRIVLAPWKNRADFRAQAASRGSSLVL
jgi:hypothetical protein